MRIGVQSIRLGTAIYLVPFCFVLNPALLFKGDPVTVIASIVAAFPGVILIAAALQGHVIGLGGIPAHAGGLITRAALIAGGFLLAAPVERLTGLPFATNLLAGAGLAIFGLLLLFAFSRKLELGRNA
jgi:TRAP-type uncharacterized transport system fused permease subunit